MNRSYRLIFNEFTRTWLAVAEIAKGRGKRASGAVLLASVGMLGAFALPTFAVPPNPPASNQLPTGGQVVAGQAALAQSGANLTVTQTSNRAAMDWATFNVGSQAQVNFVQPDSSAAILNRVLDPNPSQIFGHINANGQVFLTNPSGIYFGPTASANVGALTATTHSISNADFMSGNLSFTRNDATGKVENDGTLSSTLGGYIALLAPEVRNNGVIVAQMGTVAMAAGEAYRLQFDGSSKLANIIVSPATVSTLVENGKAIQAPGGLIILSAQALSSLQGSVVNNTGAIEARGINTSGGVIRLEAGDGQTTVSGLLDVSSNTGKGGQIVATGQQILVADGAKLTATGASGGGTVLIGGDWQGRGDIPHATNVTMQPSATIDASATQQGDGGKVVLWSDVHNANSQTTVSGSITARGGANGGSGGQVETSGHNVKIDGIRVNVGADQGKGGLWLIDPTDSTITQAVADTYASTLNGGGDVVDIAGSITWDSGVSLNKASGTNATLTLKATSDITINSGASITSTTGGGRLNTVLWADSDGNGSGSIQLSGTTISSNGGDIWISAGGGVSGSGNIDLSNGGALTITQAGDSIYSGVISGTTSSFTKAGIGNLTLTGTNTYTGPTTLSAGTLQLGDGGATGTLMTSSMTNNASLVFKLAADTSIPYAIGGTGSVEVIGQQEALFSNTSSLLGTTALTPIATNITVAEVLARLSGGQLEGGNINFYNNTYHPAQAGIYQVKFDPSTNSATLQVQDYEPGSQSYTKVVFVKLIQAGTDVQAMIDKSGTHTTGAGSLTGYHLGSDLSTSITNEFLALSPSATGYGLSALYQAAKISFARANTYAGTTTLSNSSTNFTGTYESSQIPKGTLEIGPGGSLGTGDISNDGLLLFNTSANQSVVGNVSGGGALMQSGSGTTTLAGNNTYTGDTTVNAGKLQLGTGSTTGDLNAISHIYLPSGSATFVVNRSNDLTIDNIISGVGNVEKLGANSLTFTANSSYTGMTNIDGGSLVVQNDTPTTSNTTFTGPGALTIQSSSANFSGGFNSNGWNFDNTLGGLILGRPNNVSNISINSAIRIAGPINIYGGPISIAAVLSTGTSGGAVNLTATGASGSIIESGSGLINTNGALTTSSTAATTLTGANAVGHFGVTGSTGAVSLTNTAQTLGLNAITSSGLTVNNTGALTVDGAINAGAGTVNLSATANVAIDAGITTTNATPSAIVLNSTGGDITASGGSLIYDPNGRATLYTGSVAGSKTSAALAGSAGSGRFRYNSNATATNYTAGLGAGTYEIYREKPILTITANGPSAITYGSATPASVAPALSTVVTGVNGDTVLQALSTQATVTTDGIVSTSGQLTATTHTLTASDAVDQLGYALSYASGSLIVNRLALAISGITASDKTYDGSVLASVSVAGVTSSALQAGGMISGDDLTVTASGNFRNAANTADDKNVGVAKTVLLSSSYGGADLGNYTITNQATTTASITAKPITISGITAASKQYDALTTAVVNTSAASGWISGDDLTVTASGNFRNAANTADDKNVGVAKTVLLSSSYGGADLGNYTITNQATTTASITAKPITISGITAASKQYDALTTAVVNTSAASGWISGDDLTVTASGNFRNAANTADDKNVGVAKTVLLSSSYGGADLGNYTITNQATTTASITAKPITISGITAASKQYDALTTAVVNTSAASGWISGDDLTVTASGNFRNAANTADDKNVGVAKTVLLSSSYGGADLGNYTITNQATTTASITAKPITISGITAASKQYDALTTAVVNTSAASGWISGDDLTVTASGNFRNAANTADDKNVGVAKTVLLSSSYGGADLGNYTITNQATTTASITAKPITISGITAASKQYDALTTAVVNTSAASGWISGDDLTVTASGNFRNAANTADDKNVGVAKTVLLSSSYGGADLGNYTITNQATTTASITAKPITISGITAASKQYDALTTAVVNTSAASGWISGDDLTVTASGNFRNAANTADDKNVGVAKTVLLSSSYGGADLGNYTITNQATTTASITAKPITISGITAASKQYDALTTAVVNTSAASGWISGDDLTVTASGNFRNAANTADDKNVGVAKTVLLSSSYGGADLGNYTITNQATTTASITAKPITISGITAASKQYDALTTAVVNTSAASGWISGDDLTVTASGNFRNAANTADDKNVGVAKTVLLSSSYGGADLGNYTITNQATTTASITAKPITISGITAASKQYDALTTAVVNTSAASGWISGDDLTVTASGNFRNAANTADDKNVGVAKTVLLSSSYGGADLGNYTITNQATTTASISKKDLGISGITASDKPYDGSVLATVSASGIIEGGLVAGDVVNVSATGLFDTKNAGNAKIVTLSSFYYGADARNYNITDQTSTVANITAKPLTVIANNDAKFVTQADASSYKGASYVGFIPSEDASVLGGNLTYTRTNASMNAAGTYAGVIAPSGLTSSNYAISYVNGDYTIVPADRLLVSVQNSSYTYGTTPWYNISSAQYLDHNNVIHTLSSPIQNGNVFNYSDGVGGMAVFTLAPVSEQLSTAGQLKVGNYNIGACHVTETSANFDNNLVVIGAVKVDQKALTTIASGATKVYDGNVSISNVVVGLNGLVSNDLVSVTGQGTFSQKNVGTNLTYSLSGLSLDGIDAGNYYISGGSTSSGSNGVITAKPLTISGITAGNKSYDGNRIAVVSTAGVTPNILQSGGMVAGDEILVSATGTFDNKDAAIGKSVTLSSKYSGVDVGNYQITDQNTTVANVTPKTLTVTGTSAANKTYDGSTAAVILPGSLSGLVDAETLTATATGIFDSQNAGTRYATATYTLIDGTRGGLASNYSLDSTTGLVATINKAPLTVTADNKSRLYGQANPPLTTSVSGFVNHETASTADGFTGAGSATTLADPNTPAGVAPIKAGIGTLFATNYDFTYLVDGALTIQPLQALVVPPKLGIQRLATPDTDPPAISDRLNSMPEDPEFIGDDQACTKRGAKPGQRCQPSR